MDPIKIAIAGVGNCASSLLQGIEYYRQNPGDAVDGLMHHEVAGYKPLSRPLMWMPERLEGPFTRRPSRLPIAR
jgi:hypothetical protein